MVLAPEYKTYADTLAVMVGRESTGICPAEWKAYDDDLRADKTAPELIAPVVTKYEKTGARSRFPRVGPTPQNPDGEAVPNQNPLPSGPVERPLEESTEIAAGRLQRGAEDPQRKLTQEDQEVWAALPAEEKKIAEATVAKLHADLEHSSVRQMIGALRMRKAHPSIVSAAKPHDCSACFESERRRLPPITSGKVYAPGSHLAGDQFERVHPTKDLRVLGAILCHNGSRTAVV